MSKDLTFDIFSISDLSEDSTFDIFSFSDLSEDSTFDIFSFSDFSKDSTFDIFSSFFVNLLEDKVLKISKLMESSFIFLFEGSTLYIPSLS